MEAVQNDVFGTSEADCTDPHLQAGLLAGGAFGHLPGAEFMIGFWDRLRLLVAAAAGLFLHGMTLRFCIIPQWLTE